MDILQKILLGIVKLLKGIIGGLLLVLIITGILFLRNELTFGITAIVIGALSFLGVSGNIKKPLYLLVVPALLLPVLINQYVFRFETDKGLTVCVAMLICAIITAKLVQNHYAKRKKETSSGNSENIN